MTEDIVFMSIVFILFFALFLTIYPVNKCDGSVLRKVVNGRSVGVWIGYAHTMNTDYVKLNITELFIENGVHVKTSLIKAKGGKCKAYIKMNDDVIGVEYEG